MESVHSVASQKVAMLRKWKQKEGRKATYRELYLVFKQCKRVDLAESVEQLVTETSEESKPTN